jgi:hypothetical protein
MQAALTWQHIIIFFVYFISVLTLGLLKNNRVALIIMIFYTDKEINHPLDEEQVLHLVGAQIVSQFSYLLPDMVFLLIPLHKPAYECKCRKRNLNFEELTQLQSLQDQANDIITGYTTRRRKVRGYLSTHVRRYKHITPFR